MAFNYADAPAQRDYSDLIPHGTLAFAILKIAPFNLDQGLIETPSKSSEAKFLNAELTICSGRHDKRKIFTRIGVSGSDKYVNMGRSAIRAILEVGRGANGQNNTQAYYISDATGRDDYMQLDGLKVAIKVKEEKGSEGFPPKNDVSVWLSPVDDVTGKDFARLLAGDTEPKVKPTASAAAPTATPSWQTPAAPTTATPAPPRSSAVQQTTAPKPTWLQ